VVLKDPDQYYLDLSNPLEVVKTVVYVTLTIVGDTFVTYRCYIVWNRKWYVVAVPVLLLAGEAASGYVASNDFSKTRPGAEIFLANLKPWVTSFFSLTFTTNVLCTSLLAYRILRIRSRVRKMNQTNSRVNSVVVIVVESAAIYSMSVLSLLVAYLMDSNVQYTILDLTSPIIGIAFTGIILRVSLGISSQETGLSGSRGSSSRSRGNERYPGSMNTMPLSVNLAQLVEMTKDDDLQDAHTLGSMGNKHMMA